MKTTLRIIGPHFDGARSSSSGAGTQKKKTFTLYGWWRVMLAICVLGAGAVPAGAVPQGFLPAAAGILPIDPTVVTNAALPQKLSLALGLPLQNQDGLKSLLQNLSDPHSPYYHHYLQPGEFRASFGPTTNDYLTVIRFAEANGLTVSGTHASRMLVDVTGTVPQIEKAFHVKMHLYWNPAEKRVYYAPDVEPSVPAGVPVLSISGMNNYSRPKPNLTARPVGAVAPAAGSGPIGTYMGHDFRAAYVPDTTLTGAGQTVGLVQFDGFEASDITYYESAAGLPNVPLTTILLDGFSGTPSGGDGQLEVSLDIEDAISMAPGLTNVILYEAGPDGIYDHILERMASDDSARQLSASWYIPGGSGDPLAEEIFEEMGAQGQTFFCASGDYDAFTGLIPFPCDSPHITLVGGTTLNTTGPVGSYVSETVWNWGGGIGSSGGVSTQYSIPAWQASVSMAANQGSTTMRNSPDVALTADNVYVRSAGTDWNVGGTSCAAPLWAGFVALVNQQAHADGLSPVGFANPALYAIGQSEGYPSTFHDITAGDNTSGSSPYQFYAVPGYDLCTGWGTPAGQTLINDLLNPPPTGLVAVAGDNEVTLSWNAVGGATSYNLKRSATSGGPYTTLGSPTAANYTDTSALNGHTYYYIVSAVTGGGESVNSGEVSVTLVPSAPTLLTASAGDAQVVLNWDGSYGATAYNVLRSTTSGGPYTTIGAPIATTYTDTTVANGTTYYYVVAAVNAGGQSPDSTEASATPESLPGPTLSSPEMSGSGFAFSASGVADSTWGVYASTDTTNWTLMSSLTLDGSGNGTFSDPAVTGLLYKFYRLSNGTADSQAIGFERVVVGPDNGSIYPGLGAAIADQLIAVAGEDNTLTSAFAETALPAGTQIMKYTDGALGSLYTWDGSSWSGSTTFNPGDGAFLMVPNSSNPVIVTFVGLVPTGVLTHSPIYSEYTMVSSSVPQAGGISRVLGLANPYNPETGYGPLDGNYVAIWDGYGYQISVFDSTMPTGFGNAEDEYPVPEPQVAVGEAFLYANESEVTWTQNYSDTQAPAPNLSNGGISAGSFTIGINGLAGSTWKVYASADLTNWTATGNVALDGTGAGSFTDNGIGYLQYKFYKVGNGTATSQTIGFELETVGPDNGSTHPGLGAAITDQLIATPEEDNTLSSAFALSTLPAGTAVLKYVNGVISSPYTWSGSSWSGSTTLNPGEGAFLLVPSSSAPVTVTFVGLVPEGGLIHEPIYGEWTMVGSTLPQAGGVTSVLGLANPYIPAAGYGPLDGNYIAIWDGDGYQMAVFDSTMSTGFGNATDEYAVPEPKIAVGQAFLYENDDTWPWTQVYAAQPVVAPTLSNGAITTTNFTINASGVPGSTWTVAFSADLTNWTAITNVTLNGTGAGSFTDNGINILSYRFYRFGSQNATSQAIGFERTTVSAESGSISPGLNAAIGDQLIANLNENNTLASAFAQSHLPSGTAIIKYVDSVLSSPYTWNGTSWSGSTTFNPGDGGYLMVPSNSLPLTVTFAGLVPQGGLIHQPVYGEYTLVSSIVPQAGGVSSVLGLANPYDPEVGYGPLDGNYIGIWTGTTYDLAVFDSTMSTGFGNASDEYAVPEPQVAVGQAVAYSNGAGWPWAQVYYDTPSPAPTLGNYNLASGSFSFQVSGLANSNWTVYASIDLASWVEASTVTLNGSGEGTFTDDGISGVPYRFYKLANGNATSQTIGFERVEVGAGTDITPGTNAAIADQLVATNCQENTLTSAFAVSTLPAGTTIEKYVNGAISSPYTWSGSAWSGTTTMNPGEGGFLVGPADSGPLTVSFAGFVAEGGLVHEPIYGSYTMVSSILPLEGGVSSVLGMTNPYYLPFGDGILDGNPIAIWNGDGYQMITIDSTMSTGFANGSDTTPVPEPVFSVGQAFLYADEMLWPWTQSYSAGQ